MSPRFHAFLAIVLFAAALSATTARTEQGGLIEPPSNLPRAQQGEKTINLDRLFEALKVAPDDESAKYIENRIWAIWFASGSDTANLLMDRVKMAMEAKDTDLALKLLDAIIDIRPDFIEAWNRRATLYYMKKDFGAAIADIHECSRASRAISARSPGSASSCRRSATRSRRWRPTGVRSRSIRISSAFPISPRSSPRRSTAAIFERGY